MLRGALALPYAHATVSPVLILTFKLVTNVTLPIEQ